MPITLFSFRGPGPSRLPANRNSRSSVALRALEAARRAAPICAAILLVSALTSGCKRSEPSSANNTSTPEAATSAVGSAVSPRGPGSVLTPEPATVVADPADPSATLHQLSLELRKYVLRTRTVPKNFEEFAAKSHLQAPPTPAGQKYAIQGQAVVLVKR